jgi:hypothetical protein
MLYYINHKCIAAKNNLFGTIPAELGRLLALESLNVASNDFSGTVPAVLGALVNLGTLLCVPFSQAVVVV